MNAKCLGEVFDHCSNKLWSVTQIPFSKDFYSSLALSVILVFRMLMLKLLDQLPLSWHTITWFRWKMLFDLIFQFHAFLQTCWSFELIVTVFSTEAYTCSTIYFNPLAQKYAAYKCTQQHVIISIVFLFHLVRHTVKDTSWCSEFDGNGPVYLSRGLGLGVSYLLLPTCFLGICSIW